MRTVLSEITHKLLVAVIGVGLGMGSLWYSQNHHQNPWILGAIAAGVTLIIGLLFHPVAWMLRHRPRRRRSITDTAEV